jgi:formate hydrogenlyase transcriptional activator
MQPVCAQTASHQWLLEKGPQELELLFRAIVYHPSIPILVTDGEGTSQDASAGVRRLFGVPRERVVGRRVNELTTESAKGEFDRLWAVLDEIGYHDGIVDVQGPNGVTKQVPYSAKGHVLPLRHVVSLHDPTDASGGANQTPPWVQDYALFLLDPQGGIVAWYEGAVRMYGYTSAEVNGESIAVVAPSEAAAKVILLGDLHRATLAGHLGTESFHRRKDGSQFWANTILMALWDRDGVLQGFAGAVRDFSERREHGEKLLQERARSRTMELEAQSAAVVTGEFDQILDANDAFLKMIGYSREELVECRVQWSDLTAPEYSAADEFAHEEGLQFGACTPYERNMVAKDGTQIPVRVVIATLKLAPFRWLAVVQDLRDRRRAERVEEGQSASGEQFGEIVGNSLALRRVQRQVEMVAPTDANVLILGETGTGKELVARAIHRLSSRQNQRFVTLNCAAIPTGLLESELFGYERGAFTGALTQKLGRFELANHGTLFLDEVGDIPLDLQPKLLRALQEKSFERLGGTKTIPIDVRLIAATNRDLATMMGDKLFRSDLYYRLKVFPITTPALRDRVEDVPLLVRHFTAKYAEKMSRVIDTIPVETMQALMAWPWPGNIRELENFIERSVILSRGPILRAPLDEIRRDAQKPVVAGGATLEQVEREHITRVLRESNGVVTLAATRLGLHRTTLNAMMRKLGISRKDL